MHELFRKVSHTEIFIKYLPPTSSVLGIPRWVKYSSCLPRHLGWLSGQKHTQLWCKIKRWWGLEYGPVAWELFWAEGIWEQDFFSSELPYLPKSRTSQKNTIFHKFCLWDKPGKIGSCLNCLFLAPCCSLQDVNSLTRDWSQATAVKVPHPNH